MTARERFVRTRKYVIELDAIKAKLSEHGEDWRPEGVKTQDIGDPTGNQAAYNIDVLGDVLEQLRNREEELETFIGQTLGLIHHVSIGLGYEYAEILDQRYIDGLEWADVRVDGHKVNRQTGNRKVSVAFDWIDSLGMTRILSGDYEL